MSDPDHTEKTVAEREALIRHLTRMAGAVEIIYDAALALSLPNYAYQDDALCALRASSLALRKMRNRLAEDGPDSESPNVTS